MNYSNKKNIKFVARILVSFFVMLLLLPIYAQSSTTKDVLVYPGSGTYGKDIGLTGVRDFYTEKKGDGTDVHTIMMYIIGSDLETQGGFASTDISEMLSAKFGDNINLILMTGGSHTWHEKKINSATCQYWQIKNGELLSINNNVGQLNMASPQTLTNFIQDSVSMFPATRYSIILWDHGGGTISGFGLDEYYEGSILTLSDLSTAFSQSPVKFDFVGFDACLMATAETALMLEPYADYMIASQELEPGNGWHYTNWLTNVSRYPSMHTVDIGTNIIDDFVIACENSLYSPQATLSIIELRQMPYVYEVLTDYFANTTVDIKNNEYKKISVARNDAKAYGNGACDQIDVIDYVTKANVDGGNTVIDAVNSAVRYYYNSRDVAYSHGMAMYFPFSYPDQYSKLQEILHKVGYSKSYTQFFNVFISAMAGGQEGRVSETNVQQEVDYSTENWYDSETAQIYEEAYNGEIYDELVIDKKGKDFVLTLTEEEWEEIIKIELQVLLDDGEGYMDLGSDNVYEFDDDGDLLIDFDYTWVALDGNIVPFYTEVEEYDAEDNWFTYGYVPAYLNDDDYVEVIINWNSDEPNGYVVGYRKFAETGTPIGKGFFDLKPGDTLEWIIDFYDYDLNYDDFYSFNDIYTVPRRDITVSYEDVGDMDALVYFVLTDIYNNVYETEAIVYSDY